MKAKMTMKEKFERSQQKIKTKLRTEKREIIILKKLWKGWSDVEIFLWLCTYVKPDHKYFYAQCFQQK